MREYLMTFMRECEYPEAAISELLTAYARICARRGVELSELISEYDNNNHTDYKIIEDKIKQIATESEVHEYTASLILLLCYTKRLREYYREVGIDDAIFRATVLDLRYKLDECKCVYGIWGTFVLYWFWGFFRLERFALGRLQFEIVSFGADHTVDGIALTPDTRVLNVHIPRTQERLDHASVLESYRLAADFYRPILGDKIAFVCSSWLLFPRHREMLREGANLLDFMNDYDVYASGEYQGYGEVWRLFDRAYDGDVSHLPDNTSLRRAYVGLIERGEKTGWGKGVFIYGNK